MGYIDNLKHIDGRRGLFTIVLTMTLLMIFEITFFYLLIAPKVEGIMDKKIDKLAKDASDTVNSRTEEIRRKVPVADVVVPEINKRLFNDSMKGIFRTFAEREQILMNKINMYTKITSGLVLVIFFIILYALYSGISKEVGSKGSLELSTPVLSASFTAGVIIVFQIVFYLFGRQYRYPGSHGKEELLREVISVVNA